MSKGRISVRSGNSTFFKIIFLVAYFGFLVKCVEITAVNQYHINKLNYIESP